MVHIHTQSLSGRLCGSPDITHSSPPASPQWLSWPSSRGHASAQAVQRQVSALNPAVARELFIALAQVSSWNGHHLQSPCLLVGVLSLTGWYLDTGSRSASIWKPSWWLNPIFFATPREQHCLELTLTSRSQWKFSPLPLGSGQWYSRASLPASAGSFIWFHNQLQGGDCLIYDMIH